MGNLDQMIGPFGRCGDEDDAEAREAFRKDLLAPGLMIRQQFSVNGGLFESGPLDGRGGAVGLEEKPDRSFGCR